MDLHFAGQYGHRTPPRPEAGPSAVHVVCPDDLVRWLFERQGFRCTILNDDALFVSEGRDEIVALSTRVARGWYRDSDGDDFTAYRGMSLGAVLEASAWWLTFGTLFKFASKARALVRSHSPGEVTADGSIAPENRILLDEVCKEAGVPLRWVGERRRPSPQAPVSRGYLTWPLTDHDAKRRLLNKALSLLRGPTGPRILVSYYHTLDPLVRVMGLDERVRPVFYEWPGRGLAGLAGWARWRFLAMPSSGGPKAGDCRALAAIARAYERLSVSRTYQERFSFAGLRCWEAVRLRLERLVREDIPFLACQTERLRAALDHCPPDLVVVPYDSSPPERMLTQEARSRGIPTAIVTHGVATIPLISFIDTQADHIFVGGPAHGELYVQAGVDRRRIHVTGLPLRDVYAGGERSARPKGSLPRVLVLGTSLPVEENFGRVLDLLRRHGQVPVVIRPRPGEPVEAYRKILAGRLGASVRLEARAPLKELLTRTDLVLGSASTAVLEAAAFGVPVVLLNLEDLEYPPPFTSAHGFETCRSLADLERVLARLFPDKVPERADYTPMLESFFGKGDGLCSRRIADAFLGIIRENKKEAARAR